MTKMENIKEYQNFCNRNRYVENESTVSFFCACYRKKETVSNGKQIDQLYRYINNK